MAPSGAINGPDALVWQAKDLHDHASLKTSGNASKAHESWEPISSPAQAYNEFRNLPQADAPVVLAREGSAQVPPQHRPGVLRHDGGDRNLSNGFSGHWIEIGAGAAKVNMDARLTAIQIEESEADDFSSRDSESSTSDDLDEVELRIQKEFPPLPPTAAVNNSGRRPQDRLSRVKEEKAIVGRVARLEYSISKSPSKEKSRSLAPRTAEQASRPGGPRAADTRDAPLVMGHNVHNNTAHSTELPARANSHGHDAQAETKDEGTVSGCYHRSASDHQISNALSEEIGDPRLPGLWSALQDQRQKTRVLRAETKKQRAKVQSLRRHKDTVDNDFMSLLRPLLAASSNGYLGRRTLGRQLQSSFTDMQRMRNDYMDAELQLEGLEERLDREESSLQAVELEFFEALYRRPGSNFPPDAVGPEAEEEAEDEEENLPPSRMSLRGITADRPTDVHPLYKELMSAIADKELALEEIAEVKAHQESVQQQIERQLKLDKGRDSEGLSKWEKALSVEELNALKRTASSLLEDNTQQFETDSMPRSADLALLNQIRSESKIAHSRFDKAEEEVDRLRKLCTAKGVMLKNAPLHEEITIQKPQGKWALERIDLEPHNLPRLPHGSLANPTYPILLTNPKHILKTEPQTTTAALQEAKTLMQTDRGQKQLYVEAIKEYDISTMLLRFDVNNKSDYINRWLLHRLRTSPFEVDLLQAVFRTRLRIRNLHRWQEDVLYFWSRDGANVGPQVFEGLITSDGTWPLKNGMTKGVNSAINFLGRPARTDPTTSHKPDKNPERDRLSDPGRGADLRQKYTPASRA
jgi:hypothetical protein